MNLKAYYKKLRAVEQSLTEPFAVLESHETPDGGKEGVLTEVPKHLAARMIAEGRAHIASDEAVKTFQEKKAEAKRAADQEAAAAKMQVTLVPADIRKANRGGKD